MMLLRLRFWVSRLKRKKNNFTINCKLTVKNSYYLCSKKNDIKKYRNIRCRYTFNHYYCKNKRSKQNGKETKSRRSPPCFY